jgi:hypothetical protein
MLLNCLVSSPGLRLLGSAAAGVLAVSGAVAAGPSRSCEFALDGRLSTQMELEEAQAAFLACKEERKTACKAARGRVRMLEQRLRLLRNYLDRHCPPSPAHRHG